MIQNELVLEEKFSYVICDRSALDALIYAIYSLGYEKVKSWEGFVLDHLSTYDFLFKLPIKKEYLKEDGVRAVETEYQLAIDNIFENYLEEKKIDHIKLSPEEDYAKQVLKHMNIEKI